MAYTVRFLPSAVKEFRKLGGDTRRRVAARIDELTQDPRPSGCKLLSETEGLLRVRVGDYRVIYHVDDDQKALEVLVVKIGHRRDVYRYLKR